MEDIKVKNTLYWSYCWAFIVFSLEKTLVINIKLKVYFQQIISKIINVTLTNESKILDIWNDVFKLQSVD